MEAHLARALQQENQSLKEEVSHLRDYVHSLQWLYRAAQYLLSEKDIMPLLDKTLYYAMLVLDAHDGSVLILDEETNELVFVLVQGTVRERLPGYRIPRDDGVAGWVAENAEPLIVNNARLDPRFSTRVDEAFNFETHSLVCAPLIARGKVLGVVEVLNKSGDQPFAETDQDLLSILALIAAMALDDLARQPEAASDAATAA
jgi:sigma-B regulation protein RsbU (phosphoserine phosphatase)